MQMNRRFLTKKNVILLIASFIGAVSLEAAEYIIRDNIFLMLIQNSIILAGFYQIFRLWR